MLVVREKYKYIRLFLKELYRNMSRFLIPVHKHVPEIH